MISLYTLTPRLLVLRDLVINLPNYLSTELLIYQAGNLSSHLFTVFQSIVSLIENVRPTLRLNKIENNYAKVTQQSAHE